MMIVFFFFLFEKLSVYLAGFCFLKMGAAGDHAEPGTTPTTARSFSLRLGTRRRGATLQEEGAEFQGAARAEIDVARLSVFLLGDCLSQTDASPYAVKKIRTFSIYTHHLLAIFGSKF
jgi:hypothetical protein